MKLMFREVLLSIDDNAHDCSSVAKQDAEIKGNQCTAEATENIPVTAVTFHRNFI